MGTGKYVRVTVKGGVCVPPSIFDFGDTNEYLLEIKCAS